MGTKNRILYLGNQLTKHGLNPTTVDTLGDKLQVEVNLKRASSKANTILRLLDMWLTILYYKSRLKIVLIDTYSSNAFHFAWTSAKVAHYFGVKYVAFLHGGDLPKRYLKSPIKSKSYLENAYKIISPSNYLKELTESSFNVNVDVIPNYLEMERYPFKQRNRIESLKILWVRAFHEIYNPILALEVMSLLLKKDPDATLVMVGPDKDGSLEKCKTYCKENGLTENVDFTGRLNKEDWIDLSTNCNIFLNTTNADNTPVSVMEAMALGMPVITTNVGGIPYLFEDGKEGLMVDPNDPTVIVNAIIKLAENSNLATAISKNARLKAEEWDWCVIKEKWLELL